MNKIHFLTFANSTSNFSLDRIRYEAENMQCFETIETYTEHDFDDDYWNKNKKHFNDVRGYGYWSWKPYFIRKKLNGVNNGDTLVYADAGCMLIDGNRQELMKWCELSQKSQSGILSPCFGPYFERNWTKGNAFKYVNQKYNKNHVDIFYNAVQCGAGILIITKNPNALEFVDVWNDIMENHYELCTDSPSDCGNHPQFIEHRHDQSIFSMLSKIYKIETIRSEDGILNKKTSPIICTRIRNDKNTWKRPIKVLYDNQIFDEQNFGGISRMFADVIKSLDENGIVEMFQGNRKSSQTYSRTKSLIGVHTTKNEHLIQNGFVQKNLNMTNEEYCSILKNKGDYDIFFPTFFNQKSIEGIGNKPFVMFIPDMISEIYFNALDRQNVGKREMVNYAKAIITPSYNSKKDIIKYLNVPEEKIHVIYHNLSQGFGSSYSEKSMVDFPYILYVGHRMLYKQFYLYLKYVKEFLLNHEDYKLMCTGPKFNDYEINLMRQLGLSGKIAYYHPTNDFQMASLYKHAKMFVYTSEYEGFGIPILESFKMGCPTLLNNRSCFPEIAKNAALLFEMDNERSNVVEKMECVLEMTAAQHNNLITKQFCRLEEIQSMNFCDEFYNVLRQVYNSKDKCNILNVKYG